MGGLSVLTRCLRAGRPVVLLPRFDADAVLAAVHSGGTLVSVVPTMLRALLEADRDNVLARARGRCWWAARRARRSCWPRARRGACGRWRPTA
nr:hypothetical protein [Deltaproteobacteria bacterium]